MAERSSSDCFNCGAPLDASSGTCRFCGHAVPGRGGGKAALPSEVLAAIERLRSRQQSPQALFDHLSSVLPRVIGGDASRKSKALFGGRRQLDVRIGSFAYCFKQEASNLVVERESVAGGLAVGMKDTVPASRWPELLVIDVANHADATGRDWKSAIVEL